MNEHKEIQKIFDALEEYGKRYNADYYCVILTPSEGQKVTIPGNFTMNSRSRGEGGVTIEGILEKEVLLRKPQFD